MAYTGADPISIKASVLHGAKDLRIEDRYVHPPGPDELQIAVTTTGLCGSDIHYYSHFRNGDIVVREPLTLGHESAGIVISTGANIRRSEFAPGDEVALEVGLPCGACSLCREGRYNICKEMRFRSSAKAFPHAQGTLQERLNHPARWCHKIPRPVSLELGALLEPLSVAIQANRRAALWEGSTVLVFGAGAVGLLAAGVASSRGAATVLIADIDAGRVEFAVRHGFAHRGFNVPLRRASGVDEQLEIAKVTAGEVGNVQRQDGSRIGEVDVVFECTGVPSCVQASIFATRPGGKVVLIGMGHPVQTLPISAAALREVDIIGSFRYADTYPEGIEIVSRPPGPGSPDWGKLVTHRFNGFGSLRDAFDMASKTKDERGNLVIKVMVEIPLEERGKTKLATL